jgi:hypothetical protein
MKLHQVLFAFGLCGFTACGGTGPLTNWLMTDPTGQRTSTKCVVEEGKTTKAEFNKTCGKAFRLQSSRGCDSYGRDDSKILYFCWKGNKLDKVLTTEEWLRKRGE